MYVRKLLMYVRRLLMYVRKLLTKISVGSKRIIKD